jgi:hypothetical protein
MKAGITKGLQKMKIARLAKFALAFALMLFFGNPGFADELPVGAAGTLKKDVFASEAMPAIAPPYPTDVPYVYRNLDMVIIAFTTDEHTAASVVPEGFNLLKIPQLPGQASVMAIFAKYRKNDQIGPYMETIISVPVVFKWAPVFVRTVHICGHGRRIASRPRVRRIPKEDRRYHPSKLRC